MLRETVRNLADGEPALSDAAKEQLTARMSAFLPDPALAWLVGLSADAVAAELAAEAQCASTLKAASLQSDGCALRFATSPTSSRWPRS